MTPIRQWAYFRRLAALHEAGHIVIARRVGLTEACGYIFPSVPFEEAGSTEDKLWLGKTRVSSRRLACLSRIRRCMIAVAGAIAEYGGDDPYIIDDPDGMSPANLELAGCEPEQWRDQTCLQAAHKVVEVFGSVDGRSALCSTARNLIVNSRGVDAQQRVVNARVADQGWPSCRKKRLTSASPRRWSVSPRRSTS